MLTNRLLFLILWIGLVSGPGFAAGNAGKVFIEKQQWSKYSKSYDYTEHIKQMKPKVSSHSGHFSWNGAWIKYLLWGVVITALLVLLTWLIIYVLNEIKQKVTTNKSIKSFSIENIEEADLEAFLDQSLSDGSFKEAIRIRYLMLIRTLSRLNLVSWKRDKTNGMYVNEMYGKEGFELFRRLTISFERAWYGEKEVGEAEYQTIIPVFDQMNKIVMPNE